MTLIGVCLAMLAVGGFYAGHRVPAASAYEYSTTITTTTTTTTPTSTTTTTTTTTTTPTSGTVKGSGTIAGPNGKVKFRLNAKLDNLSAHGSCSVAEGKTKVAEGKTKVKCLDVTSLTIADLGGGVRLAVLRGTATVNGTSTTYEIDAQDGGTDKGTGDSFSIHTGNGFDRSGPLTSGKIVIQDG